MFTCEGIWLYAGAVSGKPEGFENFIKFIPYENQLDFMTVLKWVTPLHLAYITDQGKGYSCFIEEEK